MTDNSTSNNLPLQLTSFIGREREIAEINRLLSSTRLLTLTGAGGCGKTRLSLQVAKDLLDSFPNGVWFVDLAPLSDSSLVPQAIATVFDLHQISDTPIVILLQNFFRAKNLLLVLDNCEHLIQACAELSDALLRACPDLKILATSREALNIAGETAFRVPSLAVPDLQKSASINDLKQSESVQLFVERAHAARPDFQMSDANTRAIAQICQRLDGMPLAIELAAARVNSISVEELATRLNDRFRLLTSGSRTALPRYQTLRASIDWSYDLLPDAERVLLRRLAVFPSGFTLDAVESVCAEGNESETLDLLSHLVQKSLVVVEQGEKPRYRLLETIREFALEKMRDAVETELLRARHLDFCLKLVKEIEPRLAEVDQGARLDVLETEYDNLRAALGWAEESDRGEAALRLANALGRFWEMRGYFHEAQERLAAVLALASANEPRLVYLRARALVLVGTMARRQNDYAAASEFYRASLAIFRTLGDEKGIADTLMSIGRIAWEQGDYESARSSYLENLAIQRELGSKPGIGYTLMHLGVVVRESGDYVEGRRLLEEALTIERDLGFKRGIAESLMHLGSTAIAQGDPAASQILEEGLAIFQELGARWDAGRCLHDLGQAAARQGDYELARSRFESSLTILREHGDRRNLVKCLEGLAGVAVAHRQTDRGARLFGASEALRERLGTPMPTTYRANHERTIAALSAQVDEEQLAKWWAEGRAMSYDQAIEYALAEQVETYQPIMSTQPHDPNALTPREIEVLRLAQAGLSDAKIAEKLVISPRTVNTHLTSIYSKLGVNSRSAATRYALDHKLI